MADDDALLDAINRSVHPLPHGSSAELDALLQLNPEAQVVLIGGSTHGTHDFYRLRAELTKRLIDHFGFNGIAVEADWPGAYRVNRFVRGVAGDPDAESALGGFRRFPNWMWRNADMLDFVGWLRERNESSAAGDRVGFYGLDLYSLHASMHAVLAYLDSVDSEAAARARVHYACFEDVSTATRSQTALASLGISESCERDVVAQLLELQLGRDAVVRSDGIAAEDEYFEAEQNARVVRDAGKFYRQMLTGRIPSWNLRETHMADTLQALCAHLRRRQKRPRIVVWAHNSHVGDARGTEMGTRGELSLGQIVRRRHVGKSLLVGVTTFGGSITAASQWGGPAARHRLTDAIEASYEGLFHRARATEFWLSLREAKDGSALAGLAAPRLQRAVGVLYKSDSERQSHYFRSDLREQFDAVIHLDHTRALEPLERESTWDHAGPPTTFPTGM